MKKTLNILLLVVVLFSFTACGNADNPVKDAEKEAELKKQVDDLKEQVSKLKDEQDGVVHTPLADKTEKADDKVVKADDKVVVKNTNSIKIDTPKDQDNISGGVVTFGGTLSAGVTKVVAKSSADNDPYTLQSFKAGATKFSYKASLDLKNLKVGQNTFEFTAYFKDGTTKTEKVTINFSK